MQKCCFAKGLEIADQRQVHSEIQVKRIASATPLTVHPCVVTISDTVSHTHYSVRTLDAELTRASVTGTALCGNQCNWLPVSKCTPAVDDAGDEDLLLRSCKCNAQAPTSKLGIPTPNPVASAMISDLLRPSSSFPSASVASLVDVAVSEADALTGPESVLRAVACVVAPVLF